MQAFKAMLASSNQSSAPAGGAWWEHFAHDADIGVRGWGSTPAEAFEQAAHAQTAAVAQANVAPRSEVGVSCSAPDLELLLVEWPNAIICEMAVRRMLFAHFAVRIERSVAGNTLERTDRLRAARPGCRAERRYLYGSQGRLRRVMVSRLRCGPSGEMRVPIVIYAHERLLLGMDRKVIAQATNVATLPGILCDA